jgi:uncharacterized protein (TIGR03437 family)
MGPRFSPQRTLLYASSVFFSLFAASAQTQFTGRCQVVAVTPQVRSEGLTEQFGDISLVCTNGTPGSILGGNLTFFFPVSVTNRVDQNNQTRDAVLLVDTGTGFAPSTIPGQIANNSIGFFGLSFPAPNGNITLKVSGIRGAVSQLGLAAQQPITASISSNLPINQSQIIVAYSQRSLSATLYDHGITCVGSPSPSTLSLSNLFSAGTAFASTRLTEGFAAAFEARRPGLDNGVRFLIKYSGFPSNAHIYVPDAVAGSDAAVPTSAGDLGVPQNIGQYVPGSNTLVLVRVNGADASGAGGFQVFPPSGSGAQTLNSVSEVTLTNGSGYVVYEVADSDPNVQETAQFPTFIAISNVTAAAVASEIVSLAPVSTVAAASTSAPIVRFVQSTPSNDCNALGDCNASYFPKLQVDATAQKISAIEKGGIMTSAPAYIPVRNSGGGLMAWTANIAYQTNSGWLFVDYPSGAGNGSVRVWSDTKNLVAGTYQATVTIDAGSAGTQTIPITLTVAAAPPITPTPTPTPTQPTVTVSGVVNAATFGATPVVPGSLATVMGKNFGGKTVAVTFDNAPATILFAGDSQINVQVPVSLAPKTGVNVVVTVDGSSSAPFAVTIAKAWPSVFSGGVLNQDNSVNGTSRAARSGDVLQIFATGIPKNAVVSAQIGDRKDLVPVYAGEAPTVPGVQQVNVAVPQGVGAAASLVLCATVPGGEQYCSTGYQVVVQ